MGYTAGSSKDTGNLDSSRRTYNIPLWDKIEELWSAKEVPFLVFTTKLSKVPTQDPKPTKLVHKSGWADRRFFSGAAASWSSQANGATIDNMAVELTVGGGDNVGFLIAGLVVRIKTTGGDTIAIIDTVDSQAQIDLTSISSTPYSIADGDEIQVIGTAFARGADKASATYDTTTSEYSYTTILKTVVDVTGTLRATGTFGMNEYQRLMEDKRAEHLTDRERNLLFGERGSTTVGSDTIYTGYGMVSYIEANSSNSNIFTPAYNSYSFDDFVDDMEDWYTKGGNQASTEKLMLCGRSPISFFSKIGDGKLWGDVTVNVQSGSNEWGINVTTVKHPHGTNHLVHEPLFRGNSTNAFYKDYMLGVDMKNVMLCPLESDGYSRDMHLVKNLQTTYDKIIHQYLTEEALLPFLSETHALFKFA